MNGNGYFGHIRKQQQDWRVTLPSGYEATIMLPNAVWYAQNGLPLPFHLLQKLEHAENRKLSEALFPEEYAEWVAQRRDETRLMVESCVLDPKIRVNADPEKGEISPLQLSTEDAVFILRYLRREIDREGNELVSKLGAFRGSSGTESAGQQPDSNLSDGGTVVDPAQ